MFWRDYTQCFGHYYVYIPVINVVVILYKSAYILGLVVLFKFPQTSSTPKVVKSLKSKKVQAKMSSISVCEAFSATLRVISYQC